MDSRFAFKWYSSNGKYFCSTQVPFFCSHDEFPDAAKGHSWLIARERPKTWVCNPTLVSFTVYSMDKTSPVKSDGESEISPGNVDGYQRS